GTYKLLHDIPVIIGSPGIVTVTAGSDFPAGIVIPAGGAFGYWSTSVPVHYETGAAGSSLVAAGNAAGTSISPTNSTALFQCRIGVSLTAGESPRNRLIIDEVFESSENVTHVGTWNFSGAGALSPNTADAMLYSTGYTTLDPVVARARFRLTDDSAVFGIVRVPAQLFGTVGVVDCANNTIEL